MSIPKEDERTPGRITETITFHFDDEEQQKRFHEILDSGPRATQASVSSLREALANSQAHADDMRKRWRDAENALYQFNYPPDPKMLREVADEIDCGQGCAFGHTEWDTNAHVCSKRDTEGCAGDNAIQLREFADAIEARAALSGVTQPAKQNEQHFVVINGGEASCVSVVAGVDAAVAAVKSLLWDGEDPPEDVLHILDLVGSPDADEWREHGDSPPHLFYQFEDGWLDIWRVSPSEFLPSTEVEKISTDTHGEA